MGFCDTLFKAHGKCWKNFLPVLMKFLSNTFLLLTGWRKKRSVSVCVGAKIAEVLAVMGRTQRAEERSTPCPQALGAVRGVGGQGQGWEGELLASSPTIFPGLREPRGQGTEAFSRPLTPGRATSSLPHSARGAGDAPARPAPGAAWKFSDIP